MIARTHQKGMTFTGHVTWSAFAMLVVVVLTHLIWTDSHDFPFIYQLPFLFIEIDAKSTYHISDATPPEHEPTTYPSKVLNTLCATL